MPVIKKKKITSEDVFNRKPIPGMHIVLWRPMVVKGKTIWVKTGNLNVQQKQMYLDKGFKEKCPVPEKPEKK